MPLHRGQVSEFVDLLDDDDILFLADTSATGRKDRYMSVSTAKATFDRPRYVSNVAPTETDDAASGVQKWNTWVDEVENIIYICTDNTTGSAVWEILHDFGGS